MDGNISKETFSHKFFKLRFNHENTFISINKLIKQQLCSTLDLYLQSRNLTFDPSFFASALESKIVVLEPSIEPIGVDIGLGKVLSTSKSAQIIYKCPITLALETYLNIAPQAIGIKLVQLINFEQDHQTSDFSLNLEIKITKSGWINFYLPSSSLANWLQQSFWLSQTKNINQRSKSVIYQLAQTPENLFFVQYVHARCCSLLNLAAREKLIVFQKDRLNHSSWQLSQPELISWLDAENNLWLKDRSQLNTIADLLAIADLLTTEGGEQVTEESVEWHQIGINFGQTVGIFLAECHFLGVVKHQYPQKAIARLGLIMLCRYWLAKILIEKLNIAAPTSL